MLFKVPKSASFFSDEEYLLEGFTTQTPTALNRPHQPHQNFDDFSKFLEKPKNFIYYEEYSNYHECRVVFAKLWC